MTLIINEETVIFSNNLCKSEIKETNKLISPVFSLKDKVINDISTQHCHLSLSLDKNKKCLNSNNMEKNEMSPINECKILSQEGINQN